MQARRARNIVTLVVAGFLILVLADRILRRNNEREELEDEISRLDGELVQRRSIARSLPGHRAFHAKIVAQLRAIEARMVPDMYAVIGALTAAGVKVEGEPPQPQGFFNKNPFKLRGESKESLVAAGLALHEAQLVFNDIRVSVDDKGAWSRSLTVFTFVDQPKPPIRPTQHRWYSRMNEELWEDLRQKKEEKAALEREIGGTANLFLDRRRLEALLNVYDQLQRSIFDFEPLIRMGFTGPAPLVRWGDLEYIKEREGVQLRGPRANPLPLRLDPCCTLIDQSDGDSWTTRWALTTGTATVGDSAAP